jgi:hypothetical protein
MYTMQGKGSMSEVISRWSLLWAVAFQADAKDSGHTMSFGDNGARRASAIS